MVSLFSFNESKDTKAAGLSGIAFAIIYVVLILLVYYAECTTIRLNQNLSQETLSIISYSYIGSLFFIYDLLGYGFMGLSTFFIGFIIIPQDRVDKIFRRLFGSIIKDKQYLELSTGQKRKLHLALALVCNPDIIILDESTAGLDVESRMVLHDENKIKESGVKYEKNN